MQVGMADVKAQVAQLGEPQQGIQVGPVCVHQAACVVNGGRQVEYVRVEQAERVRQRQHEHRRPLVTRRGERREVEVAYSRRTAR